MLSSFFDVRRRELARLLPITLAYGLVMASLYVLKPARNALFLDRLGVGQLPYVLILVAVVGGGAALLFSRVSRRVRLDRLVFSTFVVLGACLIGFRALLPTGWGWSYYLFYVWVNLYGLMATSLLWLLANALFNAREGRRLFGLIGTAGIVGAILGGWFTSWVVGALGTENLLLVCAAMLTCCLLLLYPVRLREAAGGEAEAAGEGESPLQTVRASQLLSLLAGMAGLAAAVAAIIDVQFNYLVDEAFADRDAKTAFFGQFFAGLSAFALLFQVAVTPRVLRSAGVIPALLFLPVSMALGSAAILVIPGLAAAVLLKVGDGGFRHSIHKSATEILYLPVPAAAKKRTKVLLDTTVDNLATGLGALAVVAALGAGLGYRHLSFLSFGLVALWLVTVMRSRRAYVDSFRRAIEHREIDLAGYTVDISEAGALDSLVALLRSATNERHLTYALDMLGPVRAERLVEPLTELLDHESAEVRERALRGLHIQSGPMPLARFEELLDDDHLDVRVEALQALCEHGADGRQARLQLALSSDDPRRLAAAVGCIVEHGDEDEQDLVDEGLVRALLDAAADDEEEQVQLARLMGRIYDPGRPYLRETVERLAASDHVSVVRQLAESLGEAGHDEHLPWLAGRLDDRRTRRAAAAALSRYGDRALTVLLARVDDEALSTRSRNLAARALAGIATPRCVVAVVERLDTTALGLKYQLVKTLSKLRTQDGSLGFPATEVRRAIEGAAQARRALGSVGEQLSRTTEGPATDLLRRAIDEKREQQLKIVFRCLALLYPARDLYNAYLGYMSGAPGPRSSALEFLENILVRGDRELIIPLLDEHAPEAASGPRGASVEDGAGDPTRRLLGWSDPWLRACATHTLLGSTDAETREVVRELCRDPDPVVRETAEKVLAGSG